MTGRNGRDTGGGTPALTPQIALRIATLGMIGLAVIVVLLLRLWFLQVIGSEEYAQAADGNRLRSVPIEAPRGEIVDRKGRLLASNREARNVVALPLSLQGEQRERVLRSLASSNRLDIPYEELDERMAEGDETPSVPVVLAEDVSEITQNGIEERRHLFPGISLASSWVRTYPQGTLAAHVLGYTGRIPEDGADVYRDRGYRLDERVGIAGIEAQYEEWLRGVPGERTIEVDVSGRQTVGSVVSERPARAGNTLWLNVDLDIQRVLEDQLRARTLDNNGAGAAGVALDPTNGEVLALASFPTFDPAIFVEGDEKRLRALRQRNRPELNRAIAGIYAPGSTFKAISGTAALEDEVVGPDELVDSPSQVELEGTLFRNFRGRDDGLIAMREALEISSDAFFYRIGNEFWHKTGERQPFWAREFGLGSPTRIDLPGEGHGVVPDRAWKQQIFAGPEFSNFRRSWLAADDIQLAIGQFELLATPLQMANAFAAIADRSGLRHTPTIGRLVRDRSGRVLARFGSSNASHRIPASGENLDVIRDGLFRAVNEADGTARQVFAGLSSDLRVSGKTGTAEKAGAQDSAWFIGYAPSAEPTIVSAVLVEEGGFGARAAAPAVCAVITTHFNASPEECTVPELLEEHLE